MMRSVELVYDADCPNVAAARAALLRAFARAGTEAHWTEWERNAPESPEYARRYGSPTILINGKDIAGAQPAETANSCRLYSPENPGALGVPSEDLIVAALVDGRKTRTPRRANLLTLPGMGALLLPVGVCPMCWPAYAGLLASLGLSFLLKASYIFPVTAALLLLALAALAYGARSRRRYGPLAVGVVGAGLALVGKFAFSVDLLLYLGLALLVAASLWNSWPRYTAPAGSCALCAPREPAATLLGRARKDLSHEPETQN